MLESAMIGAVVLATVTGFTPLPKLAPTDLLVGFWVSCPDGDDGAYGERQFEYRKFGKVQWTLDLGPREEFAFFAGETSEHIDHDTEANLLRPAFHYGDVPTKAGGRTWTAGRVKLNIVRIPADDECYGFAVKVEALPKETWAHAGR